MPLPAFLGNVAVTAATDDPGAAFTIESTNPLRVKIPTLGAGRRLTVQIAADAKPTCGAGDFVNTASVRASNAFELQASATLGGCVPCTTTADCASDNDDNACTTETCSNGICSHEPTVGCVACTTDADCTATPGSEPDDPWQQASLTCVQRVKRLQFPLQWDVPGEHTQHALDESTHQVDRDGEGWPRPAQAVPTSAW